MRRHCALAPLVCRHLSQRARRTHRLASSSGAKARQTSQAHASRRHCAPAGGGGVRRTPARPVSRTPAPPPYLQVVPCRHKQKGDARVAQARARAAQRDVQVAHQPEVETRVPAAPKALRWGGTAERRLRGGGGGHARAGRGCRAAPRRHSCPQSSGACSPGGPRRLPAPPAWRCTAHSTPGLHICTWACAPLHARAPEKPPDRGKFEPHEAEHPQPCEDCTPRCQACCGAAACGAPLRACAPISWGP